MAGDRPGPAVRGDRSRVWHLGGAHRWPARGQRAGGRDARRRPGIRAPGPRRLVGRNLVRRAELIHAGGHRLRHRHHRLRLSHGSGHEVKPQAAHRRRPRPRRRTRWERNRSIALAALGGGAFVVAIALLYGSTMAPSPRNGVQPVENRDEAYYAVLGRDLATSGTETNTLAVRLHGSGRVARADLVPLGRTVARFRRHHDLRRAAARRSVLHRLADRAPSRRRADRHPRPPDGGHRFVEGFRIRVHGVPISRPRRVDPGTVLQWLGRRHDLRGHNYTGLVPSRVYLRSSLWSS